MISTILTGHKANMLGSIWMIASMAIFAIEDAFVKAASNALPVGQILIIFGMGGAVMFASMARLNNEPLFIKDVVSRPMRIRVVFEIIGRLFYVLAIAVTPLSSATVILQATPLVVVAGATMVFGERVGWRRWSAIFIGLVGVIVIIQPGTDSFSMLSVLAIIGMIGFAGRDLASRAAPATLSTSILGLYGFLSIVVAGSIFSIWQGASFVLPDVYTSFNLAGAILAGVAAYSCLMKAMRTGEVSAVTPFRYTRLLFGITLGVVLFGESISSTMLLGSGLIVFSGLFIIWRRNSVE
ncbi:DMT family transporter [Sulfitobacter pontiacus]|jgi:drug/metabolite transporter (DMT)-like permease|uniref:DMT family transporter n=1 Tax=Sulfitobacter pontiacus TaxID=60137 RepID=UPI0030EEE5FC|tara:strand:- start:1970 stop:2857 length:888 start_codon:yes stop_codon:yes gene_type:complete